TILNIILGSEIVSNRYQSNISSAAKQLDDLIAGRKKIPYSVLYDAVQNATKAIQNVHTELKTPTNGGLMAVDKDDPNKLVTYNAAGIGISEDGGATYRTAMTGEGLTADVVTTGILNADQVALRGGKGEQYTHIAGSTSEMRGTFKQTWLGDTNTYDIRTRLARGHVRFRNDDERNSLYFSWNGISTYVDGEGSDEDENDKEGSSGTIR